MMTSYESRIIEALRKSGGNISTLDLVRRSGLSKTAVIKYLATFRMAGKADFQEVGTAKLWRLISSQEENEAGEIIDKSSRLNEIVKEFTENQELTGFAIVNREGSSLAAILPKNINSERLGALANLLFNVGIKCIELADIDQFRQILVEGSSRHILALNEEKVLLIAFSRTGDKLGSLKVEMEELARRINDILNQQNIESSSNKNQ